MWLTILDYREGETECIEVNAPGDTDIFVADRVGHSDFHYMSTESLVIKIEERQSENVQIITKLKQ